LQPHGLDLTILPEKRGFYENSLSGVTTNLPSKKTFEHAGTLLTTAKHRGSLI
jgi:hypothetical protein